MYIVSTEDILLPFLSCSNFFEDTTPFLSFIITTSSTLGSGVSVSTFPASVVSIGCSGLTLSAFVSGASVSTFVSCLPSVPFGPCSTDSFRVSDPTDLSLSPAVSPSRTGLDPLSSCPLVTSLFLLYVSTAFVPASRASTSNAEFLYSLYNFMYF